MGNVLSLMDQPEDETYAPRYNNPQQYQTQYPLYTTTRQSSIPYYYNTFTSTEEESTRQSYEQSRYERHMRERIKRKELEKFEFEQEEYAKKLREQEALERLRIKDEKEKHKAHDINNNLSSSYQFNKNEQTKNFKINPDIRQNVYYGDNYSYNRQIKRERY
ncbi:hypothetical protein RclHR1_02990014 [Rhizophagus clarus]|uniref:Uncharacterized protein n=1 Tax=Rhizophagus clarus TaxID=94130 RepID=A0A2Z6R5D9_9GLOM|nr:hypothetical protein RclHR1_02990014 [Rhizophagus clarus]GES88179.1 hypothetical protein GLOIN_2v1616918 [Rhizophagus clarus]